MTTATTELPQTLGKFQYEIYMEENEVNPQALPTEIKKKFVTLGMQKEAYLKKPSINRLESIKKQDAVIADLIQTWHEKTLNLPDEGAETPEEKEKRENAEQAVKAEQETKATEEKAAKAKADAQAALETKFKEIISAKGRIHVGELQRFLNKTNLKEYEEFAGIKLERGFSFLSSPYYYPLGAQ